MSWDSSAYDTTNTVADNTTAAKANFLALDGTSGTPPDKIYVLTGIVFEGATEDAFEITLTVTDPTADRTITLPDADVDFTSFPSASIMGVCKFDGTDATPITPDYQYNVSTIVKESTGTYRITWTTAMADTNYAVFVSAGGAALTWMGEVEEINTTNVLIRTYDMTSTTTLSDAEIVCVQIIGAQ